MPAPDHYPDYNPNDVARELMMPTGEPAAAVIGACLLLGMVWFAASGHFAAGAGAPHTAAAPAQSLQSHGGAVPPPVSRGAEG